MSARSLLYYLSSKGKLLAKPQATPPPSLRTSAAKGLLQGSGGYVLTTDQSNAGRAGIFSRRTNQMRGLGGWERNGCALASQCS
eukprot:1195589-Prorocentrum_minimum.AAC.3